jgi:4-diphosphocytidyl-2-C-methyl-D-erythritol kinase
MSNTRVTLALDIIRRIPSGPRAGYHELGVIKHQISLHDSILIEPSGSMNIFCSDPRVPCDNSNVCWKAAEIIKKRFAINDSVSIRIEKNIPVQGGLAGGSANAATVISMLNQMWNLRLNIEVLREIGAEVGADVPFYFTGGTCFDSETGIIEQIQAPVKFDFVLCIPPFGVSTAEAYRHVDYGSIGRQTAKTAVMRTALVKDHFSAVAENMHNDFELFVFPLYPQLKDIRDKLLDLGCPGAIMSGSGSTVIGLAADKNHAQKVSNKMGKICKSCLCVESLTIG